MVEWTLGTRFRGCAESGGLRRCEFERTDGGRFHIVYGMGADGVVRLKFARPTIVCEPTGDSCRTESDGVTVGFMPVRLG